jgi:hypothetical protein
MPHTLLSPEQQQRFYDNGVLVVPGFYDHANDVEPVQRGIYDVVGRGNL